MLSDCSVPGMTELATVVVCSSEHDILNKSSGSLVPATKAKLVAVDGQEITEHDTPGELWVQSPSATLGYLNNQRATAETFIHDDDGRWVRTGDEAVVTLAPSGVEHIVIVDRIKELIKVKGTLPQPCGCPARGKPHALTLSPQVIKLPQPNSKHICLHTLVLVTAL